MEQKSSSVQAIAPKELRSYENGWIGSNLFLTETEFGIGSTVVYSPSRRYVIINVKPWDTKYKIVVYDLVERRLLQIINRAQKFFYWYWLDENTISLLTQCYDSFSYKRYIYQFIGKTASILQLVNETVIPIIRRGEDDGNFIHALFSNDSCRLTVHGHDFLLLKAHIFVLLPYDLLSMGPHLPPLKLDISLNNIDEHMCPSPQYAFTYKNKVFFLLYVTPSGYVTDKFLQVDVTDIDINRREGIHNLAVDNPVLFVPEKLSGGSYMSGGTLINNRLIYWQDGAIVILNDINKLSHNKIWILDLEKETILEKEIAIKSYYSATLYRDYLLLWKESGKPEEVVYKFHWIGHRTPKLSDLCAVKLLQQEVAKSLNSQKYKALF